MKPTRRSCKQSTSDQKKSSCPHNELVCKTRNRSFFPRHGIAVPPPTKAREIRTLSSVMAEMGERHGRILTDSYQEDIEVPFGTIHCIPAPYFLMERELPSS